MHRIDDKECTTRNSDNRAVTAELCTRRERKKNYMLIAFDSSRAKSRQLTLRTTVQLSPLLPPITIPTSDAGGRQRVAGSTWSKQHDECQDGEYRGQRKNEKRHISFERRHHI